MECAHPTQVPSGMYTANFKAQDKPDFWCSTRLQLWEPRGQRALWIHCYFKFKKPKKSKYKYFTWDNKSFFVFFFQKVKRKPWSQPTFRSKNTMGCEGEKKSSRRTSPHALKTGHSAHLHYVKAHFSKMLFSMGVVQLQSLVQYLKGWSSKSLL